MAFKVYDTIADYNADPLPLDESRVSLVKKDSQGLSIDRLYYDSVGRTTLQPLVGDVCCIDENGKIQFLVGGNSLQGFLPSNWKLVGYVFSRIGNTVKVLDKTESSLQWLACWQYAITAISSTSITITIRCKNNYENGLPINITVANSSISSTTAAEIDTAIRTATEAVDDNTWHAWYDDSDQNNPRIIVQTDTNADYRQYQISGSGCSISLSVFRDFNWEDAQYNKYLLRKTGSAAVGGVGNVARSVNHFSTNGTTPTSNISATSTITVKRSCFEDLSNSYCAELRTTYGTYENYIAANKVKLPQKYGGFNLPDGDEMTRRYGNATAPTKSGGIMYKFPALHVCASVNYDDVDGLLKSSWKLNNETGLMEYAKRWHLNDITDGTEYLDDETLAAIHKSQTRLGASLVRADTFRWFAQRAIVYGAWFFYSQYGLIYGNNGPVTNSLAARAVISIDLTQINQSNNS